MASAQGVSPQQQGAQHQLVTQVDYCAWLLRIWRSGGRNEWHGSLQSVRSGERHMFADLDSLLAFLLAQLQTPEE